MTFLGTFEARKERWEVMSDVIDLNVRQYKSRFHELTTGNAGLPADVWARANFDLKVIIWMVAGAYRAVDGKAAFWI